jgi:hypothetical protein
MRAGSLVAGFLIFVVAVSGFIRHSPIADLLLRAPLKADLKSFPGGSAGLLGLLAFLGFILFLNGLRAAPVPSPSSGRGSTPGKKVWVVVQGGFGNTRAEFAIGGSSRYSVMPKSVAEGIGIPPVRWIDLRSGEGTVKMPLGSALLLVGDSAPLKTEILMVERDVYALGREDSRALGLETARPAPKPVAPPVPSGAQGADGSAPVAAGRPGSPAVLSSSVIDVGGASAVVTGAATTPAEPEPPAPAPAPAPIAPPANPIVLIAGWYPPSQRRPVWENDGNGSSGPHVPIHSPPTSTDLRKKLQRVVAYGLSDTWMGWSYPTRREAGQVVADPRFRYDVNRRTIDGSWFVWAVYNHEGLVYGPDYREPKEFFADLPPHSRPRFQVGRFQLFDASDEDPPLPGDVVVFSTGQIGIFSGSGKSAVQGDRAIRILSSEIGSNISELPLSDYQGSSMWYYRFIEQH